MKMTLRPMHRYFFLVEFFRKLYISFLYIRGFRSDDAFNWKLAVTVYLLLEAVVQQMLKPRIYKKNADTFVDSTAKSFLVLVLVVGTCSDASSGTQNEGAPIEPDSAFCDGVTTNWKFVDGCAGGNAEQCCELHADNFCEWGIDKTDRDNEDYSCLTKTLSMQVPILQHLLYGAQHLQWYPQ